MNILIILFAILIIYGIYYYYYNYYNKKNLIPNIIHFIFGLKPQNDEFLFSYYISIYSAWKINKPDKIYFYYHYQPYGEWFNKLYEIPNLIFEKVDIPKYIGNKLLKEFAHKADIIRMQKLYERGGIYMDMDTISVRSYKHLLNNDVVLGKEGNYGICNAIMMTKKNSEFFKIWMDEYEKHFVSDGWNEASVKLPKILYNKYPDKVTLMDEDVFFLPTYTESHKIFEIPYEIPKNLITLHLWETYSLKYLKNINDWKWSHTNKHTLYGKLLENLQYNDESWKDQISNRLTNEQKDNLRFGQQKMTEQLRQFDKFCRKYDLKYWLSGGTLIGAIRHNGWIPHDGDIDVCMIDTDFKILEENIQKELPSDMWFQSINTDPFYTCPPPLLGKLRNLDYAYIDYPGREWHNGIQLDIFIYTKENENLITKYKGSDMPNTTYNKIFPLKELYFEGIKVFAQNNYKEFLKRVYGGCPPPILPIELRVPHEGNIGKTPKWIKNKYPQLYKKTIVL